MPGFDIASIGMNAANTAVGAGMGMILGGVNDRRQLRQQQKLQDMQIKGSQQMTDYNMSKQLQMWKDTSYGAQKEQMQKAGLNPGLMYGMGGGGGQSVGSANGSVSGGEAPRGGGEAQGMGMQMMQAQLLQAQKENIQADTVNKKADTELKGVTREKTGAETGKVNAEVEMLTKNIELITKSLEAQVQKIVGESESAWTKGKVDTATVNEQTQQKVDEAVQVALKNANISQDTAQKVAEIAQKWKGLDLEERKVAVQELTGGEQKDQDQIIQLINSVVGIIGRFIPHVNILKKK